MTYCLGMSVLNDAPFIRLHLPIILQAGIIDQVICVDGGSVDDTTTELIFACKNAGVDCNVIYHRWQWDFASQQNHAIEAAEAEGHDFFFKWDPDELMWPSDIAGAFNLLANTEIKALTVGRINFEMDRLHYCPYNYPDTQLRFWRLGQGIYWRGRLHAGTSAFEVFGPEISNSSPGIARNIVNLRGCNLYHYEGIRPMAQRTLKWHNYERVKNGQPALDELPPEVKVHAAGSVRFMVPYNAPQPLDPHEIGIMAPYTS